MARLEMTMGLAGRSPAVPALAGAIWAAGLAAALACAAPAHADGFKGMAKELGKAARRAGVNLVAVLPLEPADSTDAREGLNIAERLTTQLARQGRVRAVERSLLKKLMGEALLGQTGALEPKGMNRTGGILAVDAIVTGSFITTANQAIVDARLIDAKTGAILAAVDARVVRDWHDPLGLKDSLSPIPLDPWAFGGPDGEPPLLPPPPPESIARLAADSGLRDSVAGGACEDAAERVDRLEGRVLDLKARYWASQLKTGLDLGSLRHNPGSTITDPLLKRQFYDRMKFWYARASIPPMTATEVRRFTDLDQRAFQLHRECGL